MLWVDARRNGWILQTSELAPFAGGGAEAELNRFAQAVLNRVKVDASGIDQPHPRLRCIALSGQTLELTWLPHQMPYAGESKINGRAIDYAAWPLHDSPWVTQAIDSPILRIRHGGRVLTYDFSKWTRQEQTER